MVLRSRRRIALHFLLAAIPAVVLLVCLHAAHRENSNQYLQQVDHDQESVKFQGLKTFQASVNANHEETF